MNPFTVKKFKHPLEVSHWPLFIWHKYETNPFPIAPIACTCFESVTVNGTIRAALFLACTTQTARGVICLTLCDKDANTTGFLDLGLSLVFEGLKLVEMHKKKYVCKLPGLLGEISSLHNHGLFGKLALAADL